MRITLIVPVRNEADHIHRTLSGLAEQSFPTSDYEIIVVDGMSEDGTANIVRELQQTVPNLHLFENPKRLASSARNIGVQNASGEFLSIVDGHCQIRDSHFLTKLVEAFEMSGADTLGRPQPLRAKSPTRFQNAVSAARASWLGHNPKSAIFSDGDRFVPADNVAVAYRREVFEKAGLFDETFDACEDVEFNTRVRRAGLTCYFTPTIAVEYQPRSTLKGLVHQMSRYGRGRAKLAQKHLATITLASLIPPLWFSWLLFASVISLIWSPMIWALCGSMTVYSFVLLGESHRLWRMDRELSYRRMPAIFAAIHVGFACGYLREMLVIVTSWPTLAVWTALRRLAGNRMRKA